MSNEVPTMADLYRLAYIPGQYECPKCGFVWSKSTITFDGIGTTETDRQSEPCPNDGEWMVPVTFKSACVSMQERLVEVLPELRRMRESVEALSSQYATRAANADSIWGNGSGDTLREIAARLRGVLEVPE